MYGNFSNGSRILQLSHADNVGLFLAVILSKLKIIIHKCIKPLLRIITDRVYVLEII